MALNDQQLEELKRRYYEQQLTALREKYSDEMIYTLWKRWDKPLLEPGSFTRDPETGKVTGGEELTDPLKEMGWHKDEEGNWYEIGVYIESSQQLLTKRLKDIEAELIPEIEKIDKSLEGYKKREEYQATWKKVADDIFTQTLEDLRGHGLDNYAELSDFEINLLRREVAIDLRGADCERAHFDGANCWRAHFDGADCRYAHFDGADFWGAHFYGAYCQDTHFYGAYCSEAHFDGANCYKAHFDGADCRKAHFNDADCFEAHFDGANCQDTHFDGAYCGWAHFDGANCYEAHFDGAHCREARFDGADCNSAIFDGADCRKAHFNDADCRNGSFENAKCGATNFEEANCRWAKFDGAYLKWANYSKTKLYGVNFENSKVDSNTQFDTILKDETVQDKVEDEEDKWFEWSDMVETYIQIKNAFKNRGYYDEAGHYYFREMHCRRMALPKEKIFRRAWEWFKEEALGYGERPWNMLKVIVITIGLFAFFPYFFSDCIRNGAQTTQWDILRSLYFSTVTFVTLGYGDFSPQTLGAQVITAFEGLLGVVFVALFVVSLGRKIIRD